MSDSAQYTRRQDTSTAANIGRSPGRSSAARRAVATGGEALRESAAMAGEMSRHLREAAGTAMPYATVANEHRSVAESATRHLTDAGARMADAMQTSVHELAALFALPTFASDHLRELGESVRAITDATMRTNARTTPDFFRVSGPAAAIDLQYRYATAYLDSMLHGSTMLFRARHRTVDHALRPLEEHVAQRNATPRRS